MWILFLFNFVFFLFIVLFTNMDFRDSFFAAAFIICATIWSAAISLRQEIKKAKSIDEVIKAAKPIASWTIDGRSVFSVENQKKYPTLTAQIGNLRNAVEAYEAQNGKPQ